MEKAVLLKKLGKRIARLREEKGLTQMEIGARCNKDRQSIVRIENGGRNASIYYLHEVAEALDVTLSELLAGIEKK